MIVDYSQHSIRIFQLMRKADDFCLQKDYESAGQVALEVAAEARLLCLSLRVMDGERQKIEARRIKTNANA